MPVEGVNGFLDVESAALRAPQVGIANTNPEHILSVGSNLYVSGDSSDVLTVKGNVVSEGLRLGFIEIYPSFDLEAITTVGNVTSNTIIFANVTTGFVTTANVEVGTANLFVDTTVGRVGVGTLDPEATLHVAGDTVVTGNLTVSGTTTTVDTQHLRVTDPLIELGKDNVTEIATDLGIVMTRPVGSSNVAIVYDETATSLNIGYTLGNASQAGISMESGTPLDVNIYGNVHVSSNLEVGTANLFVDTVNSRVGVGKTNPDTALDVVGTVTATALVGTNLYGTLLGSNAASVSSLTASGTVTATNLIRGVAEEAVRWNSQNETVFPQSATTQYHKIATLATTGNGSNGGKIRISGTIGGFGTSNITLIDAFVGTRGSVSYGGTLNGYGGDPTGVVDIVVYLESNGTFAVWLKLLRYFTFDFTLLGAQVSNNSRELAVLPCPTTNTSVAAPTGTLQGSVVSACSVVFADNGNVGIGTSSPEAQLHIGPKDNDHIYLASSNNNYGWKIDTDDQGAGDVPFRIIKRTNDVDTTILTIKNQDGNVGIGTTSPGHPLDVQFTGDSGIRSKNTGSSHASVYIDSATGYSYLRFEHSGAAKFWIQSTPTGDLAFRPSGGGHVMDILNNGNVGIGTSSPNASLHIDGSLINTAKIQLLQKLVTITGGNNQLHAIQQGMQLYAADSRGAWQKYQFASDSQWLIGLLGTDMVNGGSASNADMTISCKCDVTAFLISSTSGWNGVTMTGWNSLGTVASIMDGYTSTFEIWAKTLSAGTHSFDTYSAMYAFTI